MSFFPTQQPHLMKVLVYSHFFLMKELSPRAFGAVLRFRERYTHYNLLAKKSGMTKEAGHVFGIFNTKLREFRFNIGQLQDFHYHLIRENVDQDQVLYEKIPLYEPKRGQFHHKPEWAPRDKQGDAIEFMLDEDPKIGHSRLITAPTGSGKTAMSMMAAGRKGSNVVICVLPRYVQKWKHDIQNILDVPGKEVMALEKSDHLKGLISQAKEGGKVCKVTMIPLSLMTIYFDAYEEDPKYCVETYGCRPEELFELLDIGFALVDEGHEHFHTVYRLTCYMHTPLYVCLSGTMVSGDRFIAQMQHLIYPAEMRFDEIKMSKYIDVTAFQYRLENPVRDKIKTSERGMTSYSHNAYEGSIMKNKKTKANYLRQITDLVKYGHMTYREEGHKLLIFMGLKESCKEVRNHLRALYPNLTIEKYVAGDPYKNLMESDICVSTLGSAGTAHDIKGLTDVINTVSIESPQKNRQALGRLRDMGETEVRFYYLFCSDIPTHVKYHVNKRALYQPFVRSQRTLMSSLTI